MPRTFALSTRYRIQIDRVYAAFTDRRYWLARLAGSGAGCARLDAMTVDADGGIEVASTQAIHQRQLPGLVAQFHTGDLQVRRRERWSPVRDGTAHAEIAGRVVGAPAKLFGTAVLARSGGGCALDLTATVRVDVPLVGGKIESFIGTQLAELITAEQRFTDSWISQGAEPDRR